MKKDYKKKLSKSKDIKIVLKKKKKKSNNMIVKVTKNLLEDEKIKLVVIIE